jgi:hypothetical protein
MYVQVRMFETKHTQTERHVFYSNVPPKIKYLDRSRILYRNLIAEIVDNFRRILVLNAEAEYNYISAKVRENKRRWH